MRKRISAAAVVPLLLAAAAQAQTMKGLMAADVAAAARDRAIDFRISARQGQEPSSPLMGGMLVQQGVATNAFVGIGLANMYGRRKTGPRFGTEPVRSRKPAVSFVMKF